MNVFGARFRLAHGLRVSGVEGLSGPTAEAYAVCLQVGLAYAALEAFERAWPDSRRVDIVNNQIAEALRADNNRQMLEAILNTDLVVGKSRSRLEAFLFCENENLRHPAYAIRNLMFHGSLTANLLKLDSSKSRRSLIADLASSLLDVVDDEFSRYVENKS